MSEALKKKTSEDFQGPVKSFILFNQNDIQITLDLPSNLQFNQNSQEYYPPVPSQTIAPVLVNKSGFDIQSATFTVTLNNVTDTESTNVIANVQWWSLDQAFGQQVMEFTCGPVSHNSQATCTATTAGYSRIRWATMANNGRGQSNLLNSVSLVSLTFGPVPADSKKPVIGPVVLIG